MTDRIDIDVDDARFELRVWGDIGDVIERVEALGEPREVKESQDVYLVGPERGVNAKIRDGRIESKHLVDTCRGFQRWRPVWQAQLPCTASSFDQLVRELTGRRCDIRPPDGEWSQREVRAWFDEAGELDAIAVHKWRAQRDVDGVGVEIGHVDVDRCGVRIRSVAVESTDLERATRVRDRLGLDGAMNVPMHVAMAVIGARHG